MNVVKHPLIFMLGYDIGDGNIALLFHKQRFNSNDHFQLLHESNIVINLVKEIIRKNDPSKDEDILLCIATAFDITKDNISNIIEENNYIIKYKTNDKDYDIICSSLQINNYEK